MTIFISIASYCDTLLRRTILSALQNAHHPENLRFGVVDQSPPDAEDVSRMSTSQIKYVRISPKESRGCCWARAIAQSFYSGEDWFMQIDSHMDFEYGWDHYLIEWAKYLQTKNPKSIISSYPPGFELQQGFDGPPTRFLSKDVVLFNGLVRTTQFKDNGSPTLQFIADARASREPIEGFHIAAGLIFAPGVFAEKFPYDAKLYFIGEEQSLSLRAWTHGWSIWHTPSLPIYHMYNVGNCYRPLHWDSAHQATRSFDWNDLEAQSVSRFTDLVYGRKDLGVYGLGHERNLVEYSHFSGIDYLNRTLRIPQ